jgi:hypothetical protein
MRFKTLFTSCILLLHSCNNAATNPTTSSSVITKNKATATTTVAAIPLPKGYKRIQTDSTSFGAWLRKIILKPDKTVYLFNGNKKENQQAQYAVLDISVGNKDLQQCADAVMRLRAAYLFAQQKYADIVFYDNANTSYSFTPPYTEEHLLQYLQRVFGMCGSASLSRQLTAINVWNQIEPGNVLIRGGFPGHAAIVIDVAENEQGKKIYMLAQSYMPAQDIHILVNPNNNDISPWYEVSGSTIIETPEYTFKSNELKKW